MKTLLLGLTLMLSGCHHKPVRLIPVATSGVVTPASAFDDEFTPDGFGAPVPPVPVITEREK
jgi:hypothetical protein